MKPAISVVTGTRNRPEEFLRFFDSVVAAATVPTQLIIGDACDGEPSEYVAAAVAGIPEGNVIEAIVNVQRPRLGTCGGYNLGFSKATADYVAWFNDDCELEPGWDKSAIDYMDKWPEIGIGCIYFKDHTGFDWQSHYCLQHYHGMVYANFGVVRRAVGERVGWFGDTVRHYGVDNCICLATIEAGFAVVPIPGCKCKHWRTQDGERKQNLADSQVNEIGNALRRRFGRPESGYSDFQHLREYMKRFDYLAQPSCIQ